MTSGPLSDKWFSRDFPVLIEVTRRIDQTSQPVHADQLVEALGMPEEEIQSAIGALHRVGLVEGVDADGQWPAILSVAPKAYTLTGLHPGDDDITSLVEMIRSAAEQTSDPDEKTRLERLASGMRAVSSDVLKRVLAAYIAAHIPG